VNIRLVVMSKIAFVAILGLAGAFGGLGHVSAHASYDHSSPSDKQVLATSPTQLSITFVSSISPAPGTFAFVSNGDTDESAGASTVSATDPKTLILPLKPNLPAGKYDVFWKSTDADDGGVTFGHFSFFVGTASPGDVTASASAVAVAVPDDATDDALTNVNAGGDAAACGMDSWCVYCANHSDASACPKKGD
jgi:methionine-rich copper-binding protein CopC